MALGYYKGGVWVPVLPDSVDSVDYANIDTGFMVGKARPVPDGGSLEYACLGGMATGYRNNSDFTSGFPKSMYGLSAVHAPINISEFAFRVQTGVASMTVDFYLHQADTDWQPTGTPVTLATGIDVSTNGEKVVTGLDIDVDPGRYLVELYIASGTSNPRFFEIMVLAALDGDLTSLGVPGRRLFVGGASGPHQKWTNAGATFVGGGTAHVAYFKWTYR